MRTVAEAIKSDLPALATIKKEKGEAVAIAALVQIIGEAVDFFSVGKSMDDNQLGETAKLLLQEFYYLKIADLKLFFDRLKTGFYGGLYDRLDGNVIMVHLRNYCAERITTAENLSLGQHKEQQALDTGEEKFIIGTGANFVAYNTTEGYFETEHKDLACQFTFPEALRIKQWLVKDYYPTAPDTVKIKRPGTQLGLINYLQQHRPDLVPFDVARNQKVSAVLKQMEVIDNDASLSAFERYNKKEVLCGFSAVSEERFLEEERMRGGK